MIREEENKISIDNVRVIVAGSRGFNDFQLLCKTLDGMFKERIELVCGMAKGADSLGEQWAKLRGFNVNCYPADWNRFGKSAGYKRNKQMADNADVLVAFWDGQSKGTGHMIDLAKTKGLAVTVVNY